MKTGILSIGLIFFLCGFSYHTTAQVGIGTETPLARLHVADSSVLFSAEGVIPADRGTAPAAGRGRRLMWYPGKAAFRVGLVTANQWDTDQIGLISTAMGGSTTASGAFSTAMGANTRASGTASTAMGESTFATGNHSIAMGYLTTAQSYASVAIGRNNTVSGASNEWVPTDPLLVAGNGSNTARSNAMVLYKNGNLWIAGTLEQTSDARLKKNILPLNGALSLIQQLSGYHYNWNAASYSNELQTGVLAQEVQQAMPELVRENAEGQLSVNYSGLIPYLIEAIKEQQQMIEKQQAELKELKNRILLHP